MQYKLLIIDDEIDICEMLKEYFVTEGYLVELANSGKEALVKLSLKPDLILLDVNMPQMNGLELCRRIRESVNIPILFLTARVEEQDQINGFLAGGDDYIVKPFSIDELGARVMAHLRREERRTDKKKVAGVDGLLIDYSDRKVMIFQREILFTKTEFDIIALLSSNKGHIFDKESIYERLWGYGKNGDSAIITEHIRRIRGKFAKELEKEVIETVWGVGYRWIL